MPGSYGYTIEYRDSTSGVWITPSTSPNPTYFTYYDLVLDTGTTYYIRISSQGVNCTKLYSLYTLTTTSGSCCPVGYTLSPDESYCYQIQSTSPTIIQSNICLASSSLISQYSSTGTKLYNSGYDINLVGSYTLLTTSPQWKEIVGGIVGPMNREAVWVDTDCNGTKDPLTAGQTLIITIPITTSVAKTVYVGMGGDNTFHLDVNGTAVVDRPSGYGGDNFNYWHLFPVDIVSGTSYFTFKWIGDGSTNDAAAAVVYDNTQTELSAATNDSQLNILFDTSSYIGTHIDIATCPATYLLDTTGGAGSYDCIKLVTTATEAC